MSRIETNAFKDWNDGETFKSSDYEQDREIIRVANNDNFAEIEVLKSASIGVMSRVPSGTSFPEYPTVGYTFYRTDESREYIFNGTLWVGKPKMEQEVWKSLVLQNGWGSLGAGVAQPKYMLDDFGFVRFKGSVMGGAIADWTNLSGMPPALWPSERITVGVLNSDGASNTKIASLVFDADGTVKIKNVSWNNELHLNNVFYRLGAG